MSIASATCGSLTRMLWANPAGSATGFAGSPPETVQANEEESGVNSNPLPPSPIELANEVTSGLVAVDTVSSAQAVMQRAAPLARMIRAA